MSLTSYGSSGGTRGLAGPVVAGAGGGATIVATTGPGGFALQNATPIILQWTAPNDGQLHPGFVSGGLVVTAAETGGAVVVTIGVGSVNVYQGGLGIGTRGMSDQSDGLQFMLLPGGTITISQQTALTAGAATVYVSVIAL